MVLSFSDSVSSGRPSKLLATTDESPVAGVAWNDCAGEGTTPAAAWPAFADALPVLAAHARAWCEAQAALPDLAHRLTKFCSHIQERAG